MSVINEDRLLTKAELADRLAVSARQVDILNPPFIPVGARKRYDWDEVVKFLSASREVSDE